MDHCIETICSPLANLLSDAACLKVRLTIVRKSKEKSVHCYASVLTSFTFKGLKLLLKSLKNSKGTDLEARRDCMLGAWLSMTGISQGILTGASHGIGHQLGAFGVPHGYTSCIMAPHILKFNWDYLTDEMKESMLEAFGQESSPDKVLYEYLKELQMPQTLKEVEINKSSMATIAANAMLDDFTIGNIRPMTADDIESILESLHDNADSI